MIFSFLSRFNARPLVGRHVNCDLCGADNNQIIGRRDRFGAPLINVVCLDCGLVFTNPMPTDEALAHYYANEYRVHYQGESKPRAKHLVRGRRRAEERLALTDPHLPRGARLLDIGAGAGEFVAAAAAHGFVARGVEPSVDFSAFARQHFMADVRQGEWQGIDAAEGTFDLVSMHHVLEHLTHPSAVFLHVRDLLVDGGLLYVSVPDVVDPERSPHGRWHVGHVHNFASGTLDALADRTGFSPIAGAGTTRLYRKTAVPDAWRSSPNVARGIVCELNHHTTLRHFTSVKPYSRFFERALRHTAETFAGRELH